jgi:hypothetical protein
MLFSYRSVHNKLSWASALEPMTFVTETIDFLLLAASQKTTPANAGNAQCAMDRRVSQSLQFERANRKAEEARLCTVPLCRNRRFPPLRV